MPPESLPRISVIIPTLHEGPELEACLGSLPDDDDVEVIVVDGGSTAPAAPPSRPVNLIHGQRGRAAQQNLGAAHARGEILLFLHADTRLDPGAFQAVRDCLQDARVVGGAFRLAIASQRRGLRFIAASANFRARWLGGPYGDQALFVRRATFAALGGFRPLEIMEDVDFVRRLRREGRLRILPGRATTSSRRWDANGVFRTTLVNRTAALLFSFGVSARRIRRFYDRALSSGRGSEAPSPAPIQLHATGPKR